MLFEVDRCPQCTSRSPAIPPPPHTQRERELESLAAENAHIQRQIDAAKSLREGLLAEHRRVMKAVRDVADAGTRARR